MPLKKAAQISLEYMAIIGMVIIGVIAGGPYIVRSVNSYFHNLEDGIEDSLRERVGEVPMYEMPDCVCEEVPGNCGVVDCTAANATANICCYRQKDYAYTNCTPPSCQFRAPHCIFDSACCERYAENCGVIASIPLSATCSGCITESGHQSCPDGMRLYRFECGDNSNGTYQIHYECSADTSCIFQCIGTKDLNSTWCRSDYNTRLTSNYNTYMVGSGECGIFPGRESGKCVAVCNPGYLPDASYSSCALISAYECPLWYVTGGGEWATYGCIGQVSPYSSCTNSWWNGGAQFISNTCSPRRAGTPVYQCPLNWTTGGGEWASFGCQGQVSAINYCVNHWWNSGPHDINFACSALDLSSATIYKCPINWNTGSGEWASWGCQGQYSVLNYCMNTWWDGGPRTMTFACTLATGELQ